MTSQLIYEDKDTKLLFLKLQLYVIKYKCIKKLKHKNS